MQYLQDNKRPPGAFMRGFMATTDISTVKIRNLPDATTILPSDLIVVQQEIDTGKTTATKFISDLGLLKSTEITGTSGASIVGTHSGTSVQQDLDSLANFPVQMLSSAGATLVGYKRPGTSAIVRTVADKLSESVSAMDFGAVGDGVTDDTNAFLACIAEAKAKRLPMRIGGGRYKVSKTIDFTGVFYLECDTASAIIVDPSNFTHTYPEFPYAIIFGDPSTAYGTNRMNAISVKGTLRVDSQSRTSRMHGIFIKGALMDFDSLRIVGFNGEGFTASATWDSTFKSISVELCGNVNEYAFNIKSGGDTSNCLSISRIQVERAYHKCLNVNVIRSVINTIHAERCAVLSVNDGTTNLPSGLTYATFRMVLGNSTCNQIIHNVLHSGSAPDGTALAAVNASVVLNADYSSYRDVDMSDAILSSTFGRSSSYDEIGCYDWNFDATNFYDNSIRSMNVRNNLKPANNNTFMSGKASNIVVAFNAQDLSFNEVDIENLTFPNNIKGNITFSKCTFPSTFTLGDCKAPAGSLAQVAASGDKSPVTFVDCQFLGTVEGSFQSRAIFRGGFINIVNLKSRAGFEFHGVKGNTFSYDGDRGYITVNCQFKNVPAWTIPSHIFYPVGTVTQRMGATVPSNASAMYIVTAVDQTTNVSTWSAIALKSEISSIVSDISSEKGYSKVGAPGTIAQLRTIPASNGMRTPTFGYFSPFDGGGANWYFDGSNQSSNVTNYPSLFIAPSSDPTGASGAWRVEEDQDLFAIHYGVGIKGLDTSVDISDIPVPAPDAPATETYDYNEKVFYRQAIAAADFNSKTLTQLVTYNAGRKYIKLPALLIYITSLEFKGVNPKFEGVFGTNSGNSTMFMSSNLLGTGPVLRVTSSTGDKNSRLSGVYLSKILCASKDFFSVPGYNTFTDRRTDRTAFELSYIGTQYHIDNLYAGGFSRGFNFEELWDGYIGELRALYCSNPTGTVPAFFLGSKASDNVNNTQVDHLHIEFSPYSAQFGFCEHVTVNVLKCEAYRLLDATHPVVKIDAESTKFRINSFHCTTNNSTKTHAIFDYGQFTIIDGLWCAGGQEPTSPYPGIHWYKAVNANVNCKKTIKEMHMNRCYVADGSDPEDYTLILADYQDAKGTLRVSDTYSTSGGTVTTVNSGLVAVGTQCTSEEIHLIVGEGVKTAGPVFFFKGDGADIKRVTQAAGNKIFTLAGGASFNNTIGTFGSKFQSTALPIIETYGKRSVFLSTTTSVTQLLGFVSDEVCVVANATGCKIIHDVNKIDTSGKADISMVVGKPYKFFMNSNGKCTQI